MSTTASTVQFAPILAGCVTLAVIFSAALYLGMRSDEREAREKAAQAVADRATGELSWILRPGHHAIEAYVLRDNVAGGTEYVVVKVGRSVALTPRIYQR